MQGPHFKIGTTLSKEKSLGATLSQEYRLANPSQNIELNLALYGRKNESNNVYSNMTQLTKDQILLVNKNNNSKHI